jgi:type I restriction enzyme S subunit
MADDRIAVAKASRAVARRLRRLHNSGVARLVRPDPHVADTKYLLYAFIGAEWRRTVQGRLNIGATVDRLPLVDFPNFPIRLPPLDIQRKIASILCGYDELIENNTRRIKLLDEMTLRIYREWFVDFRYPGSEHVPLENSELGPKPSGWPITRLADLVSTQYGYTASASDLPIGPKFLRGMDMNKTSFVDWSTVPYCHIDAENHAKYRLQEGDIVVIRMADPGKVAIIEAAIDAVFASYLIRLTPNDDRILPHSLFFFLASDRYQAFVGGASTGTTRKSLSAPGITAITLAVPPGSIQRVFDDAVRPARQLMGQLVAANGLLRAARDVILPRLVAGEIDVEHLEIAVQEPAA